MNDIFGLIQIHDGLSVYEILSDDSSFFLSSLKFNDKW